MQPLFQTPGWSLPTHVAAESTTKKRKPASDDVSAAQATKEADKLQAQLQQITPKQSKKQRQQDGDKKSNRKRTLDKDNASKNKKIKKDQPSEKQQPMATPKQATPPKKQDDRPKQSNKKKDQPKEKQQQQTSKKNDVLPNNQKQPNSKQPVKQQPTAKKAKPDASKKDQLKALLAKQKGNKVEKKQPQPKQQEKRSTPKEQPKVEEPKVPSGKAAGLTKLQMKMKEKLSGARFRWLNEKLYTTEGNEAFGLFQEKPELFDEYHEGFRHQVESWPENPVDVILDQLRKTPAGTVVADLGCGDAVIGHTLTKQKILSYDLIAKNDKVIACDITKLPLGANKVDIAVFSLSLMGTNYIDFLKEAHRILKDGGELKIAEVVSRFPDVDSFIQLVEDLGFDFVDKDDKNKMFIMFYFTKRPEHTMEGMDGESFEGLNKRQKRKMLEGAGVRTNVNALRKQSQKLLKPCLYKRR